jgi:predicted small secreted protein
LIFNFDSNNTGTITLTSDLPTITDTVTITGTGMATTIIDGDNLYRSINNNGSRVISIQDMTFKQGKNATGGIVWTNNGTFTVNNVKFTASQGYVWHQRNSTVTTFNNCRFTYLNGGINSDYGSTPSSKSTNDSDYSDRIYINNSTFENNGTAVGTERFVKVNNSIFKNINFDDIL